RHAAHPAAVVRGATERDRGAAHADSRSARGLDGPTEAVVAPVCRQARPEARDTKSSARHASAPRTPPRAKAGLPRRAEAGAGARSEERPETGCRKLAGLANFAWTGSAARWPFRP